MAMSDHLTRVAKIRTQIVSVDTVNNVIDVVGPDGAPRRIMVWEVPSGFRWPKEGESWSIYEENGNWYLGSRANEPSDTLPISGMQPGDLRLDSSVIYDANGTRIDPVGINTHLSLLDGEIGALDTRLDILEATKPACVLNHTLINLTTGVSTLVPWDTEVADPIGMHAPNATTIIIPQTGIYSIAAQSQLQAGSPGGAFTWSVSVQLTTSIAQNPPVCVTLGNGAVGFNYTTGCAGAVSLNAGDTVGLLLLQNTGLTRGCVGNALSCVRIA